LGFVLDIMCARVPVKLKGIELMDKITFLPPHQILSEVHSKIPEKEDERLHYFNNIAMQIVDQNKQAREADRVMGEINGTI